MSLLSQADKPTRYIVHNTHNNLVANHQYNLSTISALHSQFGIFSLSVRRITDPKSDLDYNDITKPAT
ncbi:MAG TPA: hypothetical protein VEQ18_05360 [Candidatus Nitrosocosmicus sp.]|nr:hypothetical protein [Candidatus Nitrosocosmicus sp.]